MKGVKVEKIKPVFSDARGEITDLLNKNIGHVGLITTAKGGVRANHYHNLSTQYSYILSGKFKLSVARSDSPEEIEEIILFPGDLVTIEPGAIHRFEAIEDNTVMIDMISQSREGTKYEEDVVRIKIGE